MTKLFISDLHLDESRPDISAAFIHFLKSIAAKAEELYILGDLFEVWLGDDHISPFNQRIIAALKRLDVKKFIMHGNRDFLLGASFCEQTGTTLLPDPTLIDIAGKSVLLMHGDSLCTQDEEYMRVRSTLRDENFQADFLSKSLIEREAFAKAARKQSQAHTRESAMDIMDVTPAEVNLVMSSHDVSIMIHGHTHRPKVHQIGIKDKPAKRIVLGDWDQLGWYLESHKGHLDLKSFPIKSL